MYLWNFGDAANAAPATPLNMPARWKDTNIGTGRRVAHVFNDPADPYTVTCYAYEPATRRFGSQTITVTVADPNTYFADGRTIIYNPGLTANTSAYPNATVVETASALQSARNALGLTTARMLMAPGSVMTFDETASGLTTSVSSNWRMGPLEPDNPSRPSLVAVDRDGIGSGSAFLQDRGDNCAEIAFYGLDFVGEWDSATETGRAISPFFVLKSTASIAQHLFMSHRCTFDGLDGVEPLIGGQAGVTFYHMLSDTAVTNWRNYGFLPGSGSTSETIYSAVVGCSIAQHVDALSGGNKIGIYNNHGAIRDTGSDHLFVSVCDLFSRNGWSAGFVHNGLTTTDDQPGLRINTTGVAGTASQVDRVACEGSILLTEQNSTSIDVPGNHVFDKVLLVGNSRTNSSLLNCTFGGTTVRNTLAIMPNVSAAADTTRLETFMLFNNASGSAENGPAGVRAQNITGLDLRTDAQASDLTVALVGDGLQAFPVAIFENNLFHQPDRSGTTPVSGGTIDLANLLDGYAPRHKGPRYNFLHQYGTLGSTVSGSGGTLTVPYSSVTDQVYNFNLTDTGTQTDQAYWQAIEGTDTLHVLQLTGFGGAQYHADRGDIAVAFGATDITITNTSGEDWAIGTTWYLRLDRKSLLPAFVSSLNSTITGLPTSADATDTDTLNLVVTGSKVYNDLLGAERPATNDTRGAVL